MKENNYLLKLHNNKLEDLFLKKIGIPKIIIGNKKPSKFKGEFYLHHESLYNIYNNKNYKKLPPLDPILLSKLKSYESIYLRICDRLKHGSMCYEERIKSYYNQLQFWNYKLDENKITHFIQYNIPHEGYDFLIYALCKIKNIDTIFSYRLPIIKNILAKRYFITDIFKHSRKYSNLKVINSANELEESYRNLYFSIYPQKVDSNKLTKFKTYPRIAKPFKKSNFYYFNLLKNSLMKDSFKKTLMKIENRITLIHKLKYRNPYMISQAKLRKNYKKLIVNKIPNGKYIFVPLHYQPELSSVPLGKDFCEQDLLIDMISWLGEKYGFNVLVKKHPRINYEYFYVRPKNTYDQMIRHKNVFLLDEKVNSSELINNSLAVASITGSLCWEAFLRGKPSILFGSVIYDNAPGIIKVKDMNSLENFIKKLLSDKIKITTTNIISFLKHLEEFTFDHTGEKAFYAAPSHLSTKSNNENFINNLIKELI